MDLVEVAAAEGLVRRHPWEQARLAFFLRTMRAAGLVRGVSRVLDVGSGDAWLATRLAAVTGAEVVCWDSGYAAGAPSHAEGLSFTAEPPEGEFDLVLALDVAEHVEDDRAFVDRIARGNVASGGHLLFSVPAWQALFSAHDVRLRHVRRYSPEKARSLLEGAGLTVVRSGGLFHSLLLPRALQKGAELLGRAPGAHAGEWRGSRRVTDATVALLGADTRLSWLFSRLGWEIPGLSWWALCRRP